MYLDLLSERETAWKKLPILISPLSNEIIYSTTIKFGIYHHETKCIIYTVKESNCSSNSNNSNNIAIHKMYFPLATTKKTL